MKNNIDQNTPFLAFYDLLRIRGIYSEPERREKLRRGFRRAMALAATVAAFLFASPASALPSGTDASVTGSDIETVGSKMTITMSADKTFTWDTFRISDGELVDILNNYLSVHKVPSGQAVIESGGKLQSAGSVYLLAPDGVVNAGSVDVAGRFLAAAAGSASGGDISDLGSGSVVNSGSIRAGTGVWLVGKTVENSGSIQSPDVALAAFGGTGATGVTIAQAANGATITFVGVAEDAPAGAGESLTNTGSIEPDSEVEGGTVQSVAMKTSVADAQVC